MRRCALLWLLSVLCCALSANAAPEAAARPNIVLFLVDDMGWMDSGAYGSQYYDTPNIDRLAKQGMLFTDFYSANPLCSPTRASILSGKYPARLGLTTAAGHRPPLEQGESLYPASAKPNVAVLQPQSRRHLEPSEYTVAEALHDAGYRTAHLGKWHLGLMPEHWPEVQGFDVVFHGAPDPGPRSYFSPYQFPAGTVTDGPEGEYIVDRLADEAVRFMRDNRDRPFLLHLWQYGVHGPWGHKKEYTQRYVDREDPRGEQNNPIMASMLKSVDECLGRVLETLEELKLEEQTIIIFTSDNGGNTHSNTATDKTADVKPGHAKWPMVESWRKYAGYSPPTNNAPLRAGKGWLYEGGVRVPLIVRWPGVVPPGTRCDVPVMSIDFYPTMLEMAGLAKPSQQQLDGLSLVPLLKQTGGIEREALFNYFPHGGPGRPPGVTVRQGDWKLIRWFETSTVFPEQYELYNLADDLGESENLAAAEPERVALLDKLIDQFLEQTEAQPPIPNPAYDATQAVLDAWVPKGCEAVVTEEGMRFKAQGRSSFVATTRLLGWRTSGEAVLRVRTRSADGGAGRVQWRTAEQDSFPSSGQMAEFTWPGGSEWRVVEVPLAADGRLAHLRVYLPTMGEVEIERIELLQPEAEQPTLTWNFGTR